MGCCSKPAADVADEKYIQAHAVAPAAARKCRDCFCCILFLVFWVGMVVVAIIGLVNGQPERLLFGTDYNGTTCGTGRHSDRPLTFYPRMSQDLLEQAADSTLAPTDYSFFGLCVESCPAAGSYICTYEAEAEIQADAALATAAEREAERERRALVLPLADEQECWFVALPSQTVFYRCLQVTEANSTAVETCVFPADSDEYYDVVNGARVPNAKCQVKKVRTVSDATGPAQESPLYASLQTVAAVVGRCIGDVKSSWLAVLAFGGVVALALGFVFLLFLQYCAGCVVWIILWGFVLLLLLFALMLSVKGGVIGSAELNSLTTTLASAASSAGVSTGITDNADVVRASSDRKHVYAAAAYVFFALAGTAFLLVCFFQKKIRVSVGIIKEASRVIRRMPLLALFPLCPFAMMMVLFIYSAVIAAFIYSSGDIKVDKLGGGAAAASSALLAKVSADGAMRAMFAYHFFGFLWTSQLINAISMCTIAGAVSRYYWSREKSAAEMGRFPVLYSFKNCFRYHFGSLAFGAFIIAVVQFVRAVLLYIDHQTQDVQRSNLVVRVIMKIVQCCLWCLEKCLKFLSKNAYIMVAMKGKSFCASAKDALSIILSNVGQVAAVSTVSFLLLSAGKIAIAMVSAITMFAYLEANADDYGVGGRHEISSPMAPILLALLLAWFVASTFLGVYEMAIDTILLCFCEDKQLNKGSGQYYMSDTLRKFVDGVPGNHEARE